MASGVPVVASDLPVHQEICGAAAIYFQRFSAENLSQQIVRLSESPDLAQRLSNQGLSRSQEFSWSKHLEEIVALARSISAT
jgi:glycosyltransferase involved in cell wall biosynthesis